MNGRNKIRIRNHPIRNKTLGTPNKWDILFKFGVKFKPEATHYILPDYVHIIHLLWNFPGINIKIGQSVKPLNHRARKR